VRFISPWQVVSIQAAVGVVFTLAAWAFTGRVAVAWSALYGAVAVVLPTAVMAFGVRGLGGHATASPAVGAIRFLLWEGVKLVFAVVLLAIARRVVPDLSWLALLAAVIVCLKVNLVVLLWRGRPKNDERR
jgi:ATP synthase protein I